MSATGGRAARGHASVFPQQSWNSSQTSTGFSAPWMAWATFAESAAGRASAEVMTVQNPRNSRRDTPRRSSSSMNQFSRSLIGHVLCRQPFDRANAPRYHRVGDRPDLSPGPNVEMRDDSPTRRTVNWGNLGRDYSKAP